MYWLYVFSCCYGVNINKCNYFVYDVGCVVGVKMLMCFWWRGFIGVGVGGWGMLNNVDYWYCVIFFQCGDVVVVYYFNGVYYMGIYVVYYIMVFVNSNNIGRNEWFFGIKSKVGLNKVYWWY